MEVLFVSQQKLLCIRSNLVVFFVVLFLFVFLFLFFQTSIYNRGFFGILW